VTADPADLAAVRGALFELLPDRTLEGAEVLKRGHIHDTIVARCRSSAGLGERFIVQRVNDQVFRDPEALAANVVRVTSHVRAALSARGVLDVARRCLDPVISPAGSALPPRGDGAIFGRSRSSRARTRWMCRTRPRRRTPPRARSAASSPTSPISIRIRSPRRSRISTISRGDARRSKTRRTAMPSAARAKFRGSSPPRFARRPPARRTELAPGALPRRVVHNDCKLNNLLLDDRTGEALCVVDLDTVMPGTALFDFGELARTGACPAAEDERDLARVRVDMDLFAELASGFAEGARGLLGADEVRALALAGPLMALENGVRFLTDHLDGDRYFRIARPGHNLDRRARSCGSPNRCSRPSRDARGVRRARAGRAVIADSEVEKLLGELTLARSSRCSTATGRSGAGSASSDRRRLPPPSVERGRDPAPRHHGVRFIDGPRGVVLEGGATTFPVTMARGATWDVELETRIGDAIGRELQALGGNLLRRQYASTCCAIPRGAARRRPTARTRCCSARSASRCAAGCSATRWRA
jgi:hypothetical protein